MRPAFRLTCALGLLWAAPALAQSPNQLTPAEIAAGWKLLFDGKSNAGWIRTDGSAGRFLVEDSSLRTKDGDICTKDDYRDFEFSVDYRYNAGGNSGIFLRTKRGVEPPWLSGMEVGIQDNGRKGNLFKNGDASVYDVKAPSKDTWTGPGKWNTLLIRLNGDSLIHRHNGEKVIELKLGTPEWKALVADSKFSESPFPENKWGEEKQGQICLQDHGDPMLVWFRAIKVRKLEASSIARRQARPERDWTLADGPDGTALSWASALAADLPITMIRPDGSEVATYIAPAGSIRFDLVNPPTGLYFLRCGNGSAAARLRFGMP
jgi:hypothetical protein